MKKAVAYLRTSSTTNVGDDKDSGTRQRTAIEAYAKQAGYKIVTEYNDEGVGGADPIEARAGFGAMLTFLEAHSVETVILEDVSRFARDLITQEVGILLMIERKVKVLTSRGDDLTVTDDPFKIAMRQIAGAFAQLEKTRLVAKLRGARQRKRAANGKCEGRKSYVEKNPGMVAFAKKLHRYPAKGRPRSLRDVSKELASAGFLTNSGKPYTAEAISRMLKS